MRRFLVSFVCALGLLAAAPVMASAWSGSVAFGTLNVQASVGTLDDNFTITDTGANIRVVNTLGGAVAGAGCVFISTTTVDCAEAGIQALLVNGDAGNDRITIAGTSTSFNTFTCSCNLLNGGSGDDEISGHPRVAMTDTIDGGSGEDLMEAGPGPDVFIGGSGVEDTVSYEDFNGTDSRFEDLRVSIGDGPNDGSLRDGPVDARDDVQSGVEDIIGGNGDDVLIGDPQPNELSGRGGDDLLRGGGHLDHLLGGGGDDTLRGGDTDDVLEGANGDDVLRGDEGNDGLFGGSGEDLLQGGDFNDLLDGGQDADVLNGGPNAAAGDTVTYSDRNTSVNVTIGAGASNDGNSEDGISGERDTVRGTVENVIGGDAGDVLTGSEANNLFLGGNGPDVITGLAGIDTMSYNDHTAGVTVVIDGTAADGNAADGPAGARDLVKTDIENLIGSPFADSLRGSGLANVIIGGAGADSLFGLNGNDQLIANDGVADTVLNCGGGTADVLFRDVGDPAPVGCESVF